MVKKKHSLHETSTTVIVDDEADITPNEEDKVFTNLSQTLAEIRKETGVIGYILRSNTSATIDLKEPEKIVEYALFSSQVLDSSREISELFKLDVIESVLIEGKETKALCMDIDGIKISIFMERNADHTDILKRVSP
jgi:predicted regulator of Ras-like GTPase activity (Roadblock/LC7/MglB family)